MAHELPSKDILVDCTEIATTADAARYLAVSIEAIFAKERVLEQFRGLVQKFHEHADEVEAGEMQQDQIWAGAAPPTLYEADAEQRIEAEEQQVDPIPEVPEQVTMEIAFDDDNKLERGYIVNNEMPDEAMVRRLDSFFHGWLAKEKHLCRSQLILEATDTGEVKRDEQGEPVQADLDDFKERVLEKERGLQRYVQSHARGIELETLRVEVPGEPGVSPDTAVPD